MEDIASAPPTSSLCGRTDAQFAEQLALEPPSPSQSLVTTQPSTEERLPKNEWATRMRLLFTPPEMLRAIERGSLDPQYFTGSARFVDPATGVLVEMGSVEDPASSSSSAAAVAAAGGSGNSGALMSTDLRVFADSTAWGAVEYGALVEGIETCGVGDWQGIASAQKHLLYRFSPAEIRWKCAHVLGRFDLSEYSSIRWRPDVEAIQRERLFNEEVGRLFNTWQGGLLHFDADGAVEKEIASRRTKQPLVIKQQEPSSASRAV